MEARPLRTIGGDGREITLPSTVRDIRAALPADRREAFNESIENASVFDIHAVVRRWVMELLEQYDPQMRHDLDELARRDRDRAPGADGDA
ncbi:hypothetical protein [Streptomyces specialis]|uniref:hypothetical protein n=1 Tax=Streptomyces specialis TaxID=498367 RepID=UPI00073E2671|nr:hypothetical protein [Streptomyces specialis]